MTHHAVRSAAGLGVDLDRLEVAERAQAAARGLDQQPVEGVALGESEFAANHVVLGAEVADDVDALDIDARPLVDHEGDVDAAVDLVAVEAGSHLRKGIALLRGADGQGLGRLLDPLAL